MEILEIITGIIQTLGFPIACVIVMFWMWNKEREDHAKEADKWITAVNNNTAVMERLLRKIGDDTIDNLIHGGSKTE